MTSSPDTVTRGAGRPGAAVTGSAYSPVRAEGGAVRVELAQDHPGFRDPVYRARRDALAALALDYVSGMAVPHADYTETEHRVWKVVRTELAALHRSCAPREVLAAADALALPDDHIPQLDEVSALLAPLTGFHYEPVAGLASLRRFYGVLASDTFLSTQYIRHSSTPLYTPEPDIVHEVIGHATTLADPGLASLYRAAGRAACRVGDEALQVLSRVFWFTLEFGVLWERGELKAYGAGLLSSYGELGCYRTAEVRELDPAVMVTTPYDITRYQPVLFAAPSATALVEELGAFFDGFDDEAGARLAAGQAAGS